MRRRDFLKLVAGSSAGAVVFVGCSTPDLSSWGNGDPQHEFQIEMPVLNPNDYAFGRDAWYATAYPGVAGGSGLIVRVYEGRAKKVDGNPDYPLNLGRSTALEQALVQELYHPDRVTGPLTVRGNRGSGNFDAIASWDDAQKQFNDLVNANKGGGDKIVLMTGPVSGSMAAVIGQFTAATGARHVVLDRDENVVLREAMRRVFGTDRLPTMDLSKSRFLVNFGAEFLTDWISPVQFSIGYGDFRQGQATRGTYWHVGPQLSGTGANADNWIPIRPGTEGLVALAMAQVMSSENLADKGMIGNAYKGISLDQYTPDNVAQTSGASADQIRNLARMFAQLKPAVAIAGSTAASHTNGLFNLTAVYALNYLTGSLGQPGGIVLNPKTPVANALPDVTPGISYKDLQGVIAGIKGGTTKLLIVHGINPVYALPAASGFQDALGGGVTVVSSGSFIDDTAREANLILPDLTTLESWGAHVPDPGPGYATVALQQPVVNPFINNARAFGDVLLTAAKSAGGNPPWATYEDAVRLTIDALRAAGGGNVSAADPKEYFVTVQAQGGWWNTSAKAGAAPGGPSTATPAAAPQFAGDPGAFPYFLVPYPSNSLGYGENAHLPWLQALPEPISTNVWGTWVELNSKTADDLDVTTGDVLRVTSPTGNIEVPAYVNPAARPDTVYIPMGQGHTGSDRYTEKRGANPMAILAPQMESETGAFAWGATRVKVEKVGRKVKIARFEGSVEAYQLEEFPIIQVVTPGA